MNSCGTRVKVERPAPRRLSEGLRGGSFRHAQLPGQQIPHCTPSLFGAPTGCTEAGGRRPLAPPEDSTALFLRPPQLTHLQPQCLKSPPRSSLSAPAVVGSCGCPVSSSSTVSGSGAAFTRGHAVRQNSEPPLPDTAPISPALFPTRPSGSGRSITSHAQRPSAPGGGCGYVTVRRPTSLCGRQKGGGVPLRRLGSRGLGQPRSRRRPGEPQLL